MRSRSFAVVVLSGVLVLALFSMTPRRAEARAPAPGVAGADLVTVPSLIGLTERQAVRALGPGLAVGARTGWGTLVVAQVPRPGATVRAGSEVSIVLSVPSHRLPVPWFLFFVVVVAAVAMSGLLAVAASMLRTRRLRSELRWVDEDAAVDTAELVLALSDVPAGLVPGFEVELDVLRDAAGTARSWAAPMTELAVPTGVRALVSPEVDSDELIEAMARRLPGRGMTAAKMRGRFDLARPTWRLLDVRVLAAAVELLDADVADPLVEWLARYEQLRTAARRTLTDPELPEVIESVVPPESLTATHGLTVVVNVDEQEVAALRFRLDVTTTVGETSLVVRMGEITELVCQDLSVAATLTLVGWTTPLWQPEPVTVPEVHLSPRPPVLIPLVAAPPAPGAPEPAVSEPAVPEPAVPEPGVPESGVPEPDASEPAGEVPEARVPDDDRPRRTTELPPVPVPHGGSAAG